MMPGPPWVWRLCFRSPAFEFPFAKFGLRNSVFEVRLSKTDILDIKYLSWEALSLSMARGLVTIFTAMAGLSRGIAANMLNGFKGAVAFPIAAGA
jgi:hypothetical protein